MHDRRARELELDEHARRAVLERLEAPDRHAELDARLQVVDRHLEGRAHAAQHLGGEADGGAVEDAGEERAAAADFAEHGVRLDAGVGQVEERRAPAVDAHLPLERHAGRVGADDERRDALYVMRPAGRARRHDEAVRRGAVEHLDLLAAEPPAAAGALGPRLDVVRVVAAAWLLPGEREDALPRGDAGPALAAPAPAGAAAAPWRPCRA